jgi:acyl-CoA thioester hydrolase
MTAAVTGIVKGADSAAAEGGAIDLARLPSHLFACRVYYEDTDAAGIVYYANYLRFAERARTEMLRAGGLDHVKLYADTGVTLAVRRCVADYLAPARLDDLLSIESRITALRGATLELSQVVRGNTGADLVRLTVTLVAILASGKPTRIPARLRDLLAAHAARDPLSQEAPDQRLQTQGFDHHG